MMQSARKVTGAVLWANLALLFWLSLFPLVIRWIDEAGITPWPVASFGVVLMVAAIAYFLLERALIARGGRSSGVKKAVGARLQGMAELRWSMQCRGRWHSSRRSSRSRSMSRSRSCGSIPDRRFERAVAADRQRFPHPYAMEQYHGTTILGVKKGGKTVIAGDGQVVARQYGDQAQCEEGPPHRRGRQGDRRLRRRHRRRLHLVRAAGDASSSNITASCCAPRSSSPRTGGPTNISATSKR